MRNSEEDAQRWLRQSENDLEFARVGLREGFHAQVCFLCQQAAEKALKAVHYLRGARTVFGHSVWQLLNELLPAFPDLEQHRDLARQLDQYYIPTRYPNGLPAGAPFEIFTEHQAEAAVSGVEGLLAELRRLTPPDSPATSETLSP